MGIQSSMEYATFIIDFDEHTAESLLPNDDEKYILQGVLNLRAKLILDYNYPRYKEFVNLINTRLLNKYTAAEIEAVEVSFSLMHFLENIFCTSQSLLHLIYYLVTPLHLVFNIFVRTDES